MKNECTTLIINNEVINATIMEYKRVLKHSQRVEYRNYQKMHDIQLEYEKLQH